MKPLYRFCYQLPVVLLYGMLLLPSVAAQSFLPPNAASTGAVPSAEVDVPEADRPPADRPPARTSQRAGSRWTVSALGTGTHGGTTSGLEEAMKASGFGKRSGCSSLLEPLVGCSGGARHPHSSSRAGWLLDVHREVRSYGSLHGTIGVLISRTGGETSGYDGSTYLTVRQRVTTFAPMFSLRAHPALRLGLGPAWHRVGIRQTNVPEGAVRHQTRPGFVADLAVTFPTRTRFYLDLRAQYRHVGSVEVGPFESRSLGHDSFFPASRVGCSHGFIGAGVGMRL